MNRILSVANAGRAIGGAVAVGGFVAASHATLAALNGQNADFSLPDFGAVDRVMLRLRQVSPAAAAPAQTLACTQCSFEVANLSQYQEHMATHFLSHDSHANSLSCAQCSFEAVNLAQFKEHMAAHADNRSSHVHTLSCSQCNFEAVNIVHYQEHMAAHAQHAHTLACPHCPFATIRVDEFQDHLMAHTEAHTRTLACPHCPYESTQVDKFQQHVAQHAREHSYNCSQCRHQSASLVQLHTHMTEHF